MTVVYEDEWVKLIHGNYRDHIDELTALDVDAVCTDPPYGETSLDWDRWPTGWPDDAARIADVLWCFGSFKMFWNHRSEFAAWKHSQEIVWEKHNGSGFANDRFKRVHELAVMFYQGEWGGGLQTDPDDPGRHAPHCSTEDQTDPHGAYRGIRVHVRRRRSPTHAIGAVRPIRTRPRDQRDAEARGHRAAFDRVQRPTRRARG